jgi:hypothetical protein
LKIRTQVRGFALIGLRPGGPTPRRECWNAGIMGSVIKQCWVNGRICVDDKIKNGYIFLKTNLSVFQNSMFEASVQVSKNILYFN